MRESNFAFPAQNKACVCITSQLYDRRALDTTAPLPLFNSLTHLTYLTSTSPRIREIMTMDGGLERLVKILQDFCFSPPPPENPTIIYGLLPPNTRPPKPQPTLNPPIFDKHAAYRFSLAFQCVVNIGVRGSEQIRRRVVQAGTLDVVGCILEAWLVSKGFAVGPSSSATGIPRETREQRQARRQAAQEARQREEADSLRRALQMELLQQNQITNGQQLQQLHQMRQQAQQLQSVLQNQPPHRPLPAPIQTQMTRQAVEEDDPMDSSPHPGRSADPSGSFLTTPQQSASTSASNSDTDLSTNNSTAATPIGTGTPTGVVVIPTRDRSGTVIARPVWDQNTNPTNTTNNNNNNNATPIPTPAQPQRLNNMSGATVTNGGGGGRSRGLGSPSPSRSTDTSRPDTETEDDGDVDMDVGETESVQPQLPIPIPMPSISASPSPERQQPPPPPPHRTRLSLSRRAVGIVSENAPATQTLTGMDGGHAHIIINEDMGELGVGVGVEDGIVSLDQQATEDFAMGAPPGAPGAIEGTPMFGVGVGVGMGMGGTRHSHGQAPDVTPRATVIGLPGEHSNSTPVLHQQSRNVIMRGRSGTAPEPLTEPIATAGPSGLQQQMNTRTNSSGAGASGFTSSQNQSQARASTSSGVGTGRYTNVMTNMNTTTTTTMATTYTTGTSTSTHNVIPSTSTSTTLNSNSNSNVNDNMTNANHVGATASSVAATGTITATNTISSTASNSSNTTTPSTATTTQGGGPIYTGPYRDEDVLLGLQLLAYLSKYPHVRQAFYRPRQSFHPATLAYQRELGIGGHGHGHGHGGSGSGSVYQGNGNSTGKGKQPMIPPPTQKDGSYFKTFNGSSVMAPLTSSATTTTASGSSSVNLPGSISPSPSSIGKVGTGKEKAGIHGSGPVSVVGSNGGGGGGGGGYQGPKQTNVFSLVERFTFKPSSSELAINGGTVPRLPPEIQYWAGVVMRNACRKDDSRGGIRQCANMLCGRWESYPREFAKCRRCRKAKYCGKECQSTAWSEGHRFWCSAKDVDDGEGGGGSTHDRNHERDRERGGGGGGGGDRGGGDRTERERGGDGDEEDSAGGRTITRDRDRRVVG